MATKLDKKQCRIIAYFLGVTSKDIITCKLICKSWNLYFTFIIPNKIEDDEKEEEKSYIPSNYRKDNSMNYNLNTTSTIQIQRSQPVMVSRTRNKPNNMIMSTSPASYKNKEYKHDFDDLKSQSTNTSPSLNPQNRGKQRRIKPSDFLKHSLDRAFWRLDQNTLDKMIASGNSPHIKDIKITQINDGLLTEKEKIYIEKERKHRHHHHHQHHSHHSHSSKYNKQEQVHKSSSHAYVSSPPIKQHKISDYIPSHNQLLHTPTIPDHKSNNEQSISDVHTPISGPSSLKSTDDMPNTPLQYRKNDTFGSNSLYMDKLAENELKSENENDYEHKYNRNEVENILATSIKWKPQYPLHLLQNDKSYKRHDEHQQHKKRKRGEIITYDYHKKDTLMDSQSDKKSQHNYNYNIKPTQSGSIQTNKKGMKISIPFSRSLTVNKLKNKKSKKQILAHSKSRKRNNNNNNESKLLSTMFDPETFDTAILSPQQSSAISKNRRGIADKKKKKNNAISRFLHASQPISQSMTKKYKTNNLSSPFLSPASSLYSETDEFNENDSDFDNDYRANNAELEQIIREGPVKDISFLPRSKPKPKIFGISSDPRNIWASDVTTTDDDDDDDMNEDIVMDMELKQNDEFEEYIELAEDDEAIKNIGDAGSSVFGSNLSKSLLLNNNNKRNRLTSDDSLYYHAGANTQQRKRGYTTDSVEFDNYSRKIITPYELRKQHSLLRIIDGNNNKNQKKKLKPSPSLLIGGDINMQTSDKEPIIISRSRGMSNNSVSQGMNKLMGPLYSEEEKSNWNDMKKVDHKYENILKKRRKKVMVNKQKISLQKTRIHNGNLSTTDDATTITTTTTTTSATQKSKSFWSNLYDWILGDNNKALTHNSEIETSTHRILESNITNSSNSRTTTTTTASNDEIMYDRDRLNLMNGNEYELLMDIGDGIQIKQNMEDIEKKRQTETTQISFWRDIVIPNWDLLYKTSVVKLFWEREGIPRTCRGLVWHKAIGNKLNIPANSFENVYKVNEEEMNEYVEFMEKQASNIENMDENNNNSTQGIIKSILGGNNMSTRSILNMGKSKFADDNFKIVNESGQISTVNFCQGIKRKNSIERDISRLFGSESFEDLTLNAVDKKHCDIACVLMAYCNCRKSIGYIQFMTHLVQILLNYQSPKIAFISLCNMLNADIFEIYIHCNVSEIRQRIEIFTKMLVYNSSDIARHLQKLSILADTYVMDWCNGLFSAQLPINIVSRIWDLYFLNGEIIIWKCSVALLIILNENLNITKKSHHKIVKILQSIKKSLMNHNIRLNEEEFVKKIYSIKLPRDVRKWFKRKEISRKKLTRKLLKRKHRKKHRKHRKHRHRKHHSKHSKNQKYKSEIQIQQKGKLNKQNRHK